MQITYCIFVNWIMISVFTIYMYLLFHNYHNYSISIYFLVISFCILPYWWKENILHIQDKLDNQCMSIKTKYCFSIKLEIQEQTETYARINKKPKNQNFRFMATHSSLVSSSSSTGPRSSAKMPRNQACWEAFGVSSFHTILSVWW